MSEALVHSPKRTGQPGKELSIHTQQIEKSSGARSNTTDNLLIGYCQGAVYISNEFDYLPLYKQTRRPKQYEEILQTGHILFSQTTYT